MNATIDVQSMHAHRILLLPVSVVATTDVMFYRSAGVLICPDTRYMCACIYTCVCIYAHVYWQALLWLVMVTRGWRGEGEGGGQGEELGGKGGWCLGFHCNQTTMTQAFCLFRQTPQGVLYVQQQTHIQEHCRIRQSIWQGWLMHWHIHSQLGIAGMPSNPPPSTCLKQQIIFCSFPPMQFQSHTSLMKHHPENKVKVILNAVWRLPSHRHMDKVYNIISKVGASSRVPLYNFSDTPI